MASTTVSSLSASSGSYKVGSVIQIQVTFDSDLVVTGTSQLQLATSPVSQVANYIGLASGDNKTMVFSYTVQAGDSSAGLDVLSTSALTLNGGTIKSSGSDANLTLPTPGASGSLGFNANVIVDTTAPAAPNPPALDSASDLGASNSDNITAQATPTFTGTAEANVKVTLYDTDGVTVLSQGTADNSGAWSLTTSVLSFGTHNITAKATDAAGNISAASAALAVTIDTAAPSVSSINRIGAAPQNGSSVDYAVTFSENVTGVDIGDFVLSKTGTADGTLSSIDGSGNAYTISVSSVTGDGTLRLDLKNSTTGIADIAGNSVGPGFTSGQTYTLDHTGPVIGSVGVPASSSYTVGQQLDFVTNFNEAVTVTGTPRIALTLDTGGMVYADYVSGSGGSALVFRYVIVSGNEDLDGPALGGSVQLNGGSVKDAVGNNAALALNSVGSLTGVTVAGAAPSVTAISLLDEAVTRATSVQYSVAFDESVTGVDISDFTLSGQGVFGSIASITGSGATYTVTVDGISGDGTLRLDLNATGTGIVNGADIAVLSGYTSGSTYTIDQSAPHAADVFVPANGSYAIGEALTFNIKYNEAAFVTGTPRLSLTLDQGGPVYANYVSGSGTDTLTFQYLVTAGHADANGIFVTTTLDLNGGALKDAAGNDALLALNNDPALPDVLINPAAVTPPVVSPVTPPVSTGLTLVAPASGGELRGTALADTLTGSSNKDIIYTGGGPDSVDAGGGIDTVVLTGAREQYGISHQPDGSFTVRSLVDSNTIVTLKSVERLQFDDQTLAIDSTTTTARTAELYKLALGRNPEEGGLDFFNEVSQHSLTTTQLALAFVTSNEFTAHYGAVDNATFLTQLYQTAFNRAPDAEGFAFYMNNLAEHPGATGQSAVLANFIDSPEMAIKLAGIVDQGVPLLV